MGLLSTVRGWFGRGGEQEPQANDPRVYDGVRDEAQFTAVQAERLEYVNSDVGATRTLREEAERWWQTGADVSPYSPELDSDDEVFEYDHLEERARYPESRDVLDRDDGLER